MPATELAFEEHFSIRQLAEQWHVGRETVRRLIKDEPDVLTFRFGPKQRHTHYSVPLSVAVRIHTRLRRR